MDTKWTGKALLIGYLTLWTASIFVVVTTVLVASIGYVIGFVGEGAEVLNKAVQVTMFTAPGVLIGGQIGPRVQAKVNPDRMKVAISIIFIGVGDLMLWDLMETTT